MPGVLENRESITMKYLSGDIAIIPNEKRRPMNPNGNAIELKGCAENNLQDVDVKIPLGGMVCITGVSGSGKSTLINQTLLPALKRKLLGSKVKAAYTRR